MTQMGVGETTEVCEQCGAVIGNRDRHERWHQLLARSLPPEDE